MRIKVATLITLLVVGFTFQYCNPDDCGCPPFQGDYFDIQGVELVNYQTREDCSRCIRLIEEEESVRFADYRYLSVDYQVEYYGDDLAATPKQSFSLINSAFACSCIEDGYFGSQDERLDDLTVITLNDFDEQHRAGDTINDLLEVQFFDESTDLNEYLALDTALIKYDQLGLALKKAPDLNEEYHVRVDVKLSTGEVYQTQSRPIRIIN